MHACHGQAEIFCVCMHMHVTGKRKFFCVCMHACTSRASTWGPSKIIHVCTTWGCHEFFLKCFDKFEIWKKFKFIKNIKYEIWSLEKRKLGWTIPDLIQVGWTILGPNDFQPSKEALKLQYFRLVKISTFFGLGGSYPVWTISQTSGLYGIQISDIFILFWYFRKSSNLLKI